MALMEPVSARVSQLHSQSPLPTEDIDSENIQTSCQLEGMKWFSNQNGILLIRMYCFEAPAVQCFRDVRTDESGAVVVSAIDGRVQCIVCGKPYVPKKRVEKRGFNYCSASGCQKEAAAQRAKRYRDRKRSSKPGSVRDMPYRGLYRGRTNDPLFSQ